MRLSGRRIVEEPMQLNNLLLLFCEGILYFSVMSALLSLRHRIGIGVFVCALGVMHFLETYLAGVFYVQLPFGMVSPGSTVLFSGKLAMLLLLYIKEDAATVRQPIYGLLLGNALLVGLVLILRMHDVADLSNGRAPDMSFIDEMGWLMVWGTTLLVIDAIAIILLYERLGRWFGQSLFIRVAVSLLVVLTFDQAGFYLALRFIADAPIEVFIGGWVAKMGAALFYSVAMVLYLRRFEPSRETRGISDIFEILTYRERYEALVEQSGRDSLTGLLHRGRFEAMARNAVDGAFRSRRPLSLLVIDADHFKAINDRFGHSEGDRVLKVVARLLRECAATGEEEVFRIGGEEFAVLCPFPNSVAWLLGESIRQTVRFSHEGETLNLTVSIGVATLDDSMEDLDDLFRLADDRLYRAKAAGRDRVVGDERETGTLDATFASAG